MFEVFERFRTAVDVVTTSEVSVSVTVDDRRHLEAIVEALSEFSQVSRRARDGAALRRRRSAAQRAGDCGARVVGVLEEVPLRMISQAASRRNITVILRQADLPHAMQRLHEEFFAMKLLHRRLRKDGAAGRAAGARAGHGDRRRASTSDGGDWARRRTSRSISRPPTRSQANFPRYVERQLPVVIGTTGWADLPPGAPRSRPSAPGSGSWRRRTSRSASTCSR